MNDAPKKPKPPTELDLARAENVGLKIQVSTLEADLRMRDNEIVHLRKPKLHKLDPTATDRFRRPFRGR